MKNIGVLLLVLGACSSPTGKLEQLDLTYVKTPLNVPAIVSVKKEMLSNVFAKDDIKIHYDTARHGAQQVAALASGDIHIVPTMGGTSAIVGAANGADIIIIGMFGRSPKAFQIISKNPNIKTIADLKGKKIGGPKGTVLHQLLLAALKKENLSIEDVNFIPMAVPEALAGINTGDIDVALLVGPPTMVAKKQGAHLVADGEGFIDGSTVIATSRAFLEKYPHIVKKYVQAHQDSVSYINEHQEEAMALVAEEVALPIPVVSTMYSHYDFRTTMTEMDINNLIATEEFLFETGLIPNRVDIKTLIHTNF